MAKPAEEIVHNSIAFGTEITGEINVKGDIRFDGVLHGNLTATNKVVLGQVGKVFGNITCEQADIMGQVEGNITCQKLLVLKSNASVIGDIDTDTLTIEAGAALNGCCKMEKKGK